MIALEMAAAVSLAHRYASPGAVTVAPSWSSTWAAVAYRLDRDEHDRREGIRQHQVRPLNIARRWYNLFLLDKLLHYPHQTARPAPPAGTGIRSPLQRVPAWVATVTPDLVVRHAAPPVHIDMLVVDAGNRADWHTHPLGFNGVPTIVDCATLADIKTHRHHAAQLGVGLSLRGTLVESPHPIPPSDLHASAAWNLAEHLYKHHGT